MRACCTLNRVTRSTTTTYRAAKWGWVYGEVRTVGWAKRSRHTAHQSRYPWRSEGGHGYTQRGIAATKNDNHDAARRACTRPAVTATTRSATQRREGWFWSRGASDCGGSWHRFCSTPLGLLLVWFGSQGRCRWRLHAPPAGCPSSPDGLGCKPPARREPRPPLLRVLGVWLGGCGYAAMGCRMFEPVGLFRLDLAYCRG